MKSTPSKLLILVFFSSLCATIYAAHPMGSWEGAIEIPNNPLSINITLESTKGKHSGSIDIPAQGLRGFKLSNIKIEGKQVHFEMEGIPGDPRFEGTLADSGNTITGTFKQGGQTLGFSLERTSGEKKQETKTPDIPVKPIPGERMAGEWFGTLDVGPMKLRLALQVTESEANTFKAILESIDQGSAEIPVDQMDFKDRTLKFRIEKIQGSFLGKMNVDGSAIEGTWSQMGRDLPLTFNRMEKAFVLNRPQNPKPPFPYQNKEITFRNESADISLAGTFLIPEGSGPFPTVLFITGSGPQDRDESLMGHKPFLIIADYLARRGIASLRYDDRGVGKSEGKHMKSTVADFASDAEAGIAFLLAQAEVDANAIGIIGHSEGGLSGPIVASTNNAVDFLVLLAPPGEPLDQLLKRQAEDIFSLQGIEPSLINRLTKHQQHELELIKDSSIPRSELKQKLTELFATEKTKYTEAELKALKLDDATVKQSISTVSTPWFRSLMRKDPSNYLKTIQIPTLALFGEKDIQVAPEINAAGVKAALEEANNPDFEVTILQDLNHLFQHAETGSIEEYGTIEETFAPEALEHISNWIEKRFLKN